SVVRADADAIQAFHATRVDHHLVRFHFRMDQDVRGAGRGAMPTLIAGIGNPDPQGRELIGQAKESAVRAGVSAETFLYKKIDDEDPKEKKKGDRDPDGRESLQKVIGRKMVRKFRDEGSRFRAE